MTTVTLLTRDHCVLCEQARAVLARVAAEVELTVEAVDVGMWTVSARSPPTPREPGGDSGSRSRRRRGRRARGPAGSRIRRWWPPPGPSR
ncbi:MAG: glutaredoxin family protein [Acidimicrobiales bacterium]